MGYGEHDNAIPQAADRHLVIDYDKLKAAIEALPTSEGPEGATVLELAEHWKVTPGTAGKRVQKYVNIGVMEFSGKRVMPTISGSTYPVPVYKTVEV